MSSIKLHFVLTWQSLICITNHNYAESSNHTSWIPYEILVSGDVGKHEIEWTSFFVQSIKSYSRSKDVDLQGWQCLQSGQEISICSCNCLRKFI